MHLPDPFYKKTITFPFAGQEYRFHVSQELFSSHNVDHGTQRILRSLHFANVKQYRKVLDVGCGYGPLGIVLKKQQPSAEVQLVDTDALALRYSRLNATLNGVPDLHIYASLLYDSVTEHDFDLIISNIPAKIGEPAIRHLLLAARKYLKPRGIVAIVVVDAIAPFVQSTLSENPDVTITYQRAWPGHQVFHYQFSPGDQTQQTPSESAFDQGLFSRGQHTLRVDKRDLVFDVSANLPEFDQLSFQTKLLQKVLAQQREHFTSILCINVGQGYLPVFVSKYYHIQDMSLMDRNLLALITSAHNLKKLSLQDADLIHDIYIQGKQYDGIFGILPGKLSSQAYSTYLDILFTNLTDSGLAVLASRSFVISQNKPQILENFHVKQIEKSHGQTVVILKKRGVKVLDH